MHIYSEVLYKVIQKHERAEVVYTKDIDIPAYTRKLKLKVSAEYSGHYANIIRFIMLNALNLQISI